jgi:hypothetical protein
MSMKAGAHEAEIVDGGLKLSFVVPFGVDPTAFFDEAKRLYLGAVDELKKKLNG